VGYVLRKLEFEIAPIILGLVLAPMLELNFRQSLAMSAGDYTIFFTRPMTAFMLLVGLALLLLGIRSIFRHAGNSRTLMGVEPSAGPEQKGKP
jgi:putative tricarboxylic transport membrane protein